MTVDSFTQTNGEIAEARANSHPGYQLVGFGDVGVPLFELRIAAEVLDHKPIDPFAEFVLRAASTDVTDLPTMERLLGLDRRVVETTVVSLISADLLSGTDQEEVAITQQGTETLEKAKQIQVRAAQLRVTFDPLSNEVIEPFGDYLSPKQLKEERIREVRPPAGLTPELHQLEIGDVERAMKRIGSGREQARDVLALRSMRRFRVYREGVALVFQAKHAREVVVDLAFDGSVSERHSLALAEHGLRDKIVSRQASRDRMGDRMRGLQQAKLKPGPGKTEVLPPWKLSHHLSQAIEQSKDLLVITSPGLQRRVLNEEMIGGLRACVERGVSVHIGWGFEEGALMRSDPRAIKALDDLAQEFANLNVRRLKRKVDNVLIRDNRAILVSDFPWLSFSGDFEKALYDERALLIHDRAYIEVKSEEWVTRLTARGPAGIDVT